MRAVTSPPMPGAAGTRTRSRLRSLPAPLLASTSSASSTSVRIIKDSDCGGLVTNKDNRRPPISRQPARALRLVRPGRDCQRRPRHPRAYRAVPRRLPGQRPLRHLLHLRWLQGLSLPRPRRLVWLSSSSFCSRIVERVSDRGGQLRGWATFPPPASIYEAELSETGGLHTWSAVRSGGSFSSMYMENGPFGPGYISSLRYFLSRVAVRDTTFKTHKYDLLINGIVVK
jgi:hypothetical protein